jgi:hypothetical protein
MRGILRMPVPIAFIMGQRLSTLALIKLPVRALESSNGFQLGLTMLVSR